MSPSAPVTRNEADCGKIVARFVAAAREVAATVEVVERSASVIATTIANSVPNAKRIVIAEPHDISNDLFALCWTLPGVFGERTRAALASADVGVTDAFAGIASTGTVCVRGDRGITGYASLLARTHVVVLDSERIVERPGDLFRDNRLNGEGLRANFVYITGPSATADMGPLVRGVHGPHFLHIIVVT